MSNTTTGGKSIRQVTGHQSRLILAVVCAVSLFGAASTFAQGPKPTNETVHARDQTFQLNHPCTFQPVTVVLHSHEQMMNKGDDFTFKLFENGKGQSDLDPNERYQFSSSTQVRARSSTPNLELTIHTRRHFIRQGPGIADDWYEHEKITFSPLSTPVFGGSRAECK